MTNVHAFLGLQISGALIFTILTPIAFFHFTVKRHPVWFSFAASWIVYGVSYSFLLFAGQQYKAVPERKLCMVQTGLVYATPYLAVSTSSGLVFHLLLNVVSALSRRSLKLRRFPVTMTVLAVAPWIIWAAVLISVLIFAFSRPEQVVLSPNRTYCIILDTALPRVTAVYVAVLASTILFAEVVIGIMLYRNRAIQDMLRRDMTMSVRILIFTLLGCATFGVALVFSVTRTRGVEFDLIIAVLPPTSAIIFGTQSDLLHALWSWNPRSHHTEDTTSSVSLTTVRSAPHQRWSYAHAAPVLSGFSRQERSFRSDRGTISSREPGDGLESIAISLSVPATPVTPALPDQKHNTFAQIGVPESPKPTSPKSPYSANPSFLKF
ncbi:hypothetical protein BJ165DRAFT_297670 [Panaeolus papilionaceus]|nr:hypothetical protein BJ165DRAFT_297670 [Panaeolus papilionaceus]